MFFYADRKLLDLAASFQASSRREVTKFLSISRRVRSVLRQGDKPKFVSAFCQSNCGDVSPNVLGAFCIDTGLPCDFNHSTCGGKNELCYGRGPGYAITIFLKELPLILWVFFSVHANFEMYLLITVIQMNLRAHVLLEKDSSGKLLTFLKRHLK